MFRGSSLSSYNGREIDTVFDIFLKQLGGTSYINTFTPTPDTNRSMSTFFSGVPAFFNGCQKKGSSLSNLNVDTFLHLLLQHGFSINALLYEEYHRGYFPQDLLNKISFISGSNIFEQLNYLTVQENSFTFIDLPDAHIVVNDYIAFPSSENVYNSLLTKILNDIQEILKFNEFDYVFLFSDHGHAGYFDSLRYKKNELLDNRRTQLLMHIKKRNDNEFKTNDKLHSIADIYDTILDITGFESERKSKFGNVSFFSSHGRDHIIFEEMYGFYLGSNQVPELWACKTPYGFYQVDSSKNEIIVGDFEGARQILFSDYPAIYQYIEENDYFSKLLKTSFSLRRNTFSNGSKRYTPLKIRLLHYIYFTLIPNKLRNYLKSVLFRIIMFKSKFRG